MDSQTQPKLPVIDFSLKSLKAGTSCWNSVRNEVRCALEEYGCFEAVYDKVSSQLCSTIFSESEELFNLPIEIKIQNTYTKPFHGYETYPTFPLFETMGIDDATNLQGVQSFTNLMWPSGNGPFCESAHLFANLVAELDKMVTRMVFESYGVAKYYDSYAESTNYLLRFLKYRVPGKNENNFGIPDHSDKSFTSILHQNQVNCLEIKTKDGKWFDYQPSPSPSSLLFFVGDAFMAWSNGRIHAPVHRVIMSANKVKYTLVQNSFIERMIKPPEELVDEEHPLRFKPFDHMEFIHFLQTKESKVQEPMKAYCGV